MAIWITRPGEPGRWEEFALVKGLAVTGWERVPDVSRVKSRNELLTLLRRTWPKRSAKAIAQDADAIWSFVREINPDDLVILPLNAGDGVAIGEITGKYIFRPDLPDTARHVRAVRWLSSDVSLTTMDGDITRAISRTGTVAPLRIDRAEERIRERLEGS